MKKTLSINHLFLIIGIITMIPFSTKAQNIDCTLATTVCGNTPVSGNNSSIGIDDFANPNNQSGCLGINGSTGAVEVNPHWYTFTTATAGLLEFTITPNNMSNDYDFALFGPAVTCDNLGSPIRCNFSGNPGLTGISNTSFGPTFDNGLNVLAGETYYLLVTNWSNSTFGFDLNWGRGVDFVADIQADFSVASQTCNQITLQNTSSSCLPTIDSQWDFGDGSPISTDANPTHTYTNSGTYTITLTVSAGIYTSTTQQTVNIILPPAFTNILDNQEYCINEPAFDLQATPAGGNFYINGVLGSTFTPQALGAGTHTIRYELTDPTCNQEIFINAIVNPEPVLQIMNIQNQYCIDDGVQVNITTNPTFDLSNDVLELDGVSATNFVPSALSLGTHTIRFEHTDAAGCLGILDFTFTIQDLPNISVDLDDIYCMEADNIPLSNGIYSINGASATEFSPSNLGAGTYTVTYTYTDPSTNCTNTTDKEVQILEVIPSQLYEDKICSFSGRVLELDAREANTYLWYEADKPEFPLSQERIYETEEAGTYKVKITNDYNCETVHTFEVKENCNPRFYIPNAFTPNNDGTNDVFKVFGNDLLKYRLQIMNRWGEVVFYTEDKDKTWDGTYGGNKVPEGIYICIVKYQELPSRKEKEVKSKLHLIR